MKKEEGLHVEWPAQREQILNKILFIKAHGNSRNAASMVATLEVTLAQCQEAITKTAEKQSEPIPEFETIALTPRHSIPESLQKPVRNARVVLFAAQAFDLGLVESICKIAAHIDEFKKVRWCGIILHGHREVYEQKAYGALAALNQAGVAILPRAVACLANDRAKQHLTLGAEVVRALYSFDEWDSSGGRGRQAA